MSSRNETTIGITPELNPTPHAATTAGSSVPDGPLQVELPITGLTCSSCTVTVERSLQALPGVEQAAVSYSLGKAKVTYDPAKVSVDQMVGAVEAAGYTVERPLQADAQDEETAAHAREYRTLMRKFWLAAAVAVPVMLVAYPDVPWLYLPNWFAAEI